MRGVYDILELELSSNPGHRDTPLVLFIEVSGKDRFEGRLTISCCLGDSGCQVKIFTMRLKNWGRNWRETAEP